MQKMAALVAGLRDIAPKTNQVGDFRMYLQVFRTFFAI